MDPKQRYIELLRSVQHHGASEGELQATPLKPEQLQELEALWIAGQLGHKGSSPEGLQLNIRDHGIWNRFDGPQFLHVEMDIDGRWVNGQVALTEYAEDWEKRGYHQNKDYADVLIQLCLHPVPPQWVSLSCNQRRVLVIPLPKRLWQEALSLPIPLDGSKLKLCKKPLENMQQKALISLLQAACQYRMALKRERFEQRARALGRSQAWYEAWAESLGYYSNRRQMKLLARRAPLHQLTPDTAEAILLGTANFLVPKLPESAESDDRQYHRDVWDKWWNERENFQLHGQQLMQWQLAGLRPLNHPSRRVAALALTVQRWAEFEALLHADKLADLEQFRQSLLHPYWNHHHALPSAQGKRSMVMVGKERMKAFLINHLFVNDEQALAWQLYLKQKESSTPGKVKKLASLLLGDRDDLATLLPYCYVQQGLLQLGLDFTAQETSQGEYPENLLDWE